MEKALKTRIDLFLYPDVIIEERGCRNCDIPKLLEKRGLTKKHPNDKSHGCTIDENADEIVYIWW